MITSHNDADVFDTLIRVTIDSADGYRKAADDAHNHAFQSIFYDRAQERDVIVGRMQQHVRSLGKDPVDSGSMSAGAHRLFMGLRAAIAGKDDDAIIDEVERGEDIIKEAYERAIANPDISIAGRQLIEQCYTSVRAGHDQMRDLKHGMGVDTVTPTDPNRF